MMYTLNHWFSRTPKEDKNPLAETNEKFIAILKKIQDIEKELQKVKDENVKYKKHIRHLQLTLEEKEEYIIQMESTIFELKKKIKK